MHDQIHLKLLFIINPHSGSKKLDNWEALIKKYFEGSHHVLAFYFLSGKEDKEAVRNQISWFQPNRLISVGGDGTIKMLAEITIGTDLILGIIPAGSANGMAKELGIPAEVERALKIIVEGKKGKIDAIKINNKEICIHLSDIGLNAMLIKYFERSGGRGMWGYVKAFFKVFWGKKNIYAVIKTDEQVVNRKAYMIVIANARTYGTGAIINPDGQVDDGRFEIVVIRKMSIWELCKMLLTHQPFDTDCIEVFTTKTLSLTTRRKTYFQVDGEFLGKTTNIKADILPRQVNIMLPL